MRRLQTRELFFSLLLFRFEMEMNSLLVVIICFQVVSSCSPDDNIQSPSRLSRSKRTLMDGLGQMLQMRVLDKKSLVQLNDKYMEEKRKYWELQRPSLIGFSSQRPSPGGSSSAYDVDEIVLSDDCVGNVLFSYERKLYCLGNDNQKIRVGDIIIKANCFGNILIRKDDKLYCTGFKKEQILLHYIKSNKEKETLLKPNKYYQRKKPSHLKPYRSGTLYYGLGDQYSSKGCTGDTLYRYGTHVYCTGYGNSKIYLTEMNIRGDCAGNTLFRSDGKLYCTGLRGDAIFISDFITNDAHVNWFKRKGNRRPSPITNHKLGEIFVNRNCIGKNQFLRNHRLYCLRHGKKPILIGYINPSEESLRRFSIDNMSDSANKGTTTFESATPVNEFSHFTKVAATTFDSWGKGTATFVPRTPVKEVSKVTKIWYTLGR